MGRPDSAPACPDQHFPYDAAVAAAKKPQRQWRDYRTVKGARPVKDFLNDLTDDEVAAIVAGMKEVVALGMRAARHLRGEIYEVRADAATRSFRLLFAAEGRYSHVLLSLSVFEKRTQKTPPAEMAVAEARLKDWRTRGAAKKAAASQKKPGKKRGLVALTL